MILSERSSPPTKDGVMIQERRKSKLIRRTSPRSMAYAGRKFRIGSSTSTLMRANAGAAKVAASLENLPGDLKQDINDDIFREFDEARRQKN